MPLNALLQFFNLYVLVTLLQVPDPVLHISSPKSLKHLLNLAAFLDTVALPEPPELHTTDSSDLQSTPLVLRGQAHCSSSTQRSEDSHQHLPYPGSSRFLIPSCPLPPSRLHCVFSSLTLSLESSPFKHNAPKCPAFIM